MAIDWSDIDHRAPFVNFVCDSGEVQNYGPRTDRTWSDWDGAYVFCDAPLETPRKAGFLRTVDLQDLAGPPATDREFFDRVDGPRRQTIRPSAV